jgi:uncharacterized protein (DUF302 family)
MIRYAWPSLAVLLLALALVAPATAETTLLTRTAYPFERAMGILQQTLAEYGYQVAHVQRCDGGMADFGYKSDLYRVVFFGKIDEVRQLSARYPELVPYLPLKILLFAEQQETVMVALNPLELANYFEGRELQVQFQRWHSDLRAIFAELGPAAGEDAGTGAEPDRAIPDISGGAAAHVRSPHPEQLAGTPGAGEERIRPGGAPARQW